MKHLDANDIKQLEIFRDLLPEEWAEVHPLLNHVWTIEGEDLVREGDRAHTFYIVLRGHFMLHYKDGRAITLNRKGDIIGWSTVMSPFRYTASVTSLSQGELLSMPGSRFLELLQSNASLAEKLVKKINETIEQRHSID
jgi:CRP-like cAMP-binding protein